MTSGHPDGGHQSWAGNSQEGASGTPRRSACGGGRGGCRWMLSGVSARCEVCLADTPDAAQPCFGGSSISGPPESTVNTATSGAGSLPFPASSEKMNHHLPVKCVHGSPCCSRGIAPGCAGFRVQRPHKNFLGFPRFLLRCLTGKCQQGRGQKVCASVMAPLFQESFLNDIVGTQGS